MKLKAAALAAILCVQPSLARADPISALAALAPIIGGTAAAFVVSNFAAIAFIGLSVFGAASARRKARRMAAQQRAAYNASLQDRSITLTSATPAWRVIYGRCIVGGDVVDVLTTDKTVTKEFAFVGGFANSQTTTKPDAYKHLVIHLATHEVEAINEVYIDGIAVGTLDGDGWATGGEFGKTEEVGRVKTFTSSTTLDEPVVSVLSCYETDPNAQWSHSDVTPTVDSDGTGISVPGGKTVTFNYTINETTSSVRIRKFLGTDSQSIESYLDTIAPTWDNTDHHGKGLAIVVITVDLEEPRFQSGQLGLTFDVSGKKLYDPRTETTVWSDNPALCVRDFLLGEYGYDCDEDDVDDTFVIAAANACDSQIDLTIGATTETNVATFTCNGLFTSDQSQEAVLEDLVECMAGFAVYGAQWQIHAGAWTEPVMALTDDDLEGQISIAQAGAGVDELFNGCRGTYIPEGKSAPTDAEPYQNATFLADDGRELWSDFTLPFTDNKARAKNLFRIFVERSRSSMVIQYPAKLKALALQVGDRVTVTSTEYGFSAKTFRVTDWQFGITSPVMLTLQEDAADIYDLADAAVSDPTPNTNLPNPWVVNRLGYITATSNDTTATRAGSSASVSPRVVVEFEDTSDAYVRSPPGYIELQWRRHGRDYESSRWPGDSNIAEIIGVNDGDQLIIKARAVNGLGTAGPWIFTEHVVDGPTRIGTDEIIDEAATSVLVDQADSVAVTTSVIPISRLLPQAGTYEILLSGRATVTSFSANDELQVWFSLSGAGTSYGDDLPTYPIRYDGQVIQISQAMTLLETGAGPWQIDVALDISGHNATATISNLMMRSTLVKK